MRLRLKKSEILRGRGRFSYVARKGKKLRGQIIDCAFLAIRERDDTSLSPLCVGFKVGRETGNAAKRNRVRRLMRESYRLHRMDSLAPAVNSSGLCVDLVLHFPRRGQRPSTLPSFQQIEQDIIGVLSTIAAMVGEHH